MQKNYKKNGSICYLDTPTLSTLSGSDCPVSQNPLFLQEDP